jgi:hypothetical protein
MQLATGTKMRAALSDVNQILKRSIHRAHVNKHLAEPPKTAKQELYELKCYKTRLEVRACSCLSRSVLKHNFISDT